MTEEFDDDIVFENSPLFQYLRDLGHTDFEACPTATREDGYGGSEGDVDSPDEAPQKTLRGRLWRLAKDLWRLSPFHRGSAARKLGQQLDCVFGRYSVGCILDQDVLLQEDVELIELLDPSLLALGSSPSGSSSRRSPLPRPGLSARPSIWDMAALVGLAAVLLALCSTSGGVWTPAAAPWAAALLGWVGLRGTALWRRGCMQRDVYDRAAQLQTLIHNGKALTGLSRKALRLVQETEVISRGFTLLLDRVSAAGSFSRAGPAAMPRGQQLVGLRKALYRALRSAFRSSRRATCHMLKAFPLSSEIDNVTNYVSAVPLKELGLGLGIERLGDEQARELTDDYSLPALKMLFQLWLGQSSECFRRLALLLSPQRIEESEDGGPKGDASRPPPRPLLHQSVAAVTEPLRHALGSCLAEVQRSYDFHRHFEAQLRTTGPDRTGRVGEKCRELNALHTSIRSLQLHLKALLSEMIILEDDLEKLMVSKEPVALTLEGYQDISGRLHHLQPHMQASAGCWEDTVSQVERMLRRAGACSGNGESPQQFCPPVPEIPASPPSYPLILDRDPVPEELEWEAYVSDSESDGEGAGSWTDVLSPEERERQRREREESRRVLSELKAVLGFRASDGERMKRKQLLFSDQAAVTPSASSESTDPPTKPLDSAASLGSVESDEEEGNHISQSAAGNQGEEEEGSDARARPDPSAEPVTEFCCGLEAKDGDLGGSSVSGRGGGGASELHQYEGVLEEREEQNGLDCFLNPKLLAVSLMDRLTELHGPEVLSIGSALAAQAAARSHSLIKMEEQTFGEEDEEEESEPNP
ncbi:vezatin [Brachionichthys hirsutus]|uniref:vezatin n=1 Tax=Brachionichthys hirsutus TaxID=412623 RepID=UPI0036051489